MIKPRLVAATPARCGHLTPISSKMLNKSALRRRISELERAKSHETALLDAMQERLVNLQHELNASATYPVLSLPHEIISEIFIHCLEASESHPDWPNSDPRTRPPWLFAQICSTWREIALATPELWNRMSLCLDFEGSSTNILDTFAARARAVPLDLLLWADLDLERMPLEEQAAGFLPCLQRHASRIASLQLETGTVAVDALHAMSFDFARLEQLRMFTDTVDPRWSWTQEPFACFRHAFALRSLELRGTSPQSIDLPWTNLTTLRMHGRTTDNCMLALRLAPNLTEAELELNWTSEWIPPPNAFTHPRIRRLKLTEAADDPLQHGEARKFGLAHLTLAALEAFEIDPSVHMPPQIMHDFLKRSCPPLRNLAFKSQGSQDSGLGAWSSMEPFTGLGITSLSIDCPPLRFSELFFNTMRNNADMLPLLESLSVTCDEKHTSSSFGLYSLTGRVADAIHARQRLRATVVNGAQCPLRSLKLLSLGLPGMVFDLPANLASLGRLEALKAAGMEVYVGTATQRIL
ncbi:F-box domain-containing protein [Mycena chlorophos]|uniref:F-box domain-containing protein n=1 Tax=Mycena chlorophos TaxID=658473 RepID=A0A8H6S8H2_MYCCL|nr:F-box domain-containing protein [Mycena chlorophos]